MNAIDSCWVRFEIDRFAGHHPHFAGEREAAIRALNLGEQVDTRSGNLNYTLPLLSAQGRGGWAVPFALSYNSQMWRKDPGGIWNFGKDVGFGYGWRFLAGS